jgi:hypothetical protein
LKNLDLPFFAKIAGNIPVESGDIEIISTGQGKYQIKLTSRFSN